MQAPPGGGEKHSPAMASTSEAALDAAQRKRALSKASTSNESCNSTEVPEDVIHQEEDLSPLHLRQKVEMFLSSLSCHCPGDLSAVRREVEKQTKRMSERLIEAHYKKKLHCRVFVSWLQLTGLEQRPAKSVLADTAFKVRSPIEDFAGLRADMQSMQQGIANLKKENEFNQRTIEMCMEAHAASKREVQALRTELLQRTVDFCREANADLEQEVEDLRTELEENEVEADDHFHDMREAMKDIKDMAKYTKREVRALSAEMVIAGCDLSDWLPADRESLHVDSVVLVKTPFETGNADHQDPQYLETGMAGVVVEIDESGDAKVYFPGLFRQGKFPIHFVYPHHLLMKHKDTVACHRHRRDLPRGMRPSLDAGSAHLDNKKDLPDWVDTLVQHIRIPQWTRRLCGSDAASSLGCALQLEVGSPQSVDVLLRQWI
eukprot:TRINITY_DN123151_c0_g1_i1.p1 TRINITY_DN123151_c0_g1~~TRINITY_DN123151_c0_g1_i1.p1  ORF type:complete len:433 (+),score=75.43 TRINITY_DN123151_c0_g1_i1:92-1390(+)